MDPEKIIEGLFKELGNEIKSMSKAKTVEDKVAYSQIIKNLCESMGVFFNFASDMMDDMIDFDIDD